MKGFCCEFNRRRKASRLFRKRFSAKTRRIVGPKSLQLRNPRKSTVLKLSRILTSWLILHWVHHSTGGDHVELPEAYLNFVDGLKRKRDKAALESMEQPEEPEQPKVEVDEEELESVVVPKEVDPMEPWEDDKNVYVPVKDRTGLDETVTMDVPYDLERGIGIFRLGKGDAESEFVALSFVKEKRWNMWNGPRAKPKELTWRKLMRTWIVWAVRKTLSHP